LLQNSSQKLKNLRLKLSRRNDFHIRNIIYLVGIFLLTIYLSSCAKPVILPDISLIDTDDYISRIQNDQNIIKSLKGLAVVRLSSPRNKISYRQATIVQSPNLMRLEAYSILGRTEALIISDGDMVGIKFAGRRWVYYDADQFDFSLFYKVIPIKINTDQLTSFLLGKIPEYVFNDDFTISADQDDGLLIFTSINGDNVLYVNHDYHKVVKAKIRLNNGEKLKVEYGDFKTKYNGVYFPTKLELKYMDYSIYVKYDNDIDINEEINQSSYSMSK